MIINRNSKYVQGVLKASELHHPEKYVGKIRDKIVFRSSLEKSFMHYLDNNLNVLEWSSEETVILYQHPVDKRTHRFFPDFFVKFKNDKGKICSALIEIKPYNQTVQPVLTERQRQSTKKKLVEQWAVNCAKWKAAEKWCKRRDMVFIKITENDLMFIKK